MFIAAYNIFFAVCKDQTCREVDEEQSSVGFQSGDKIALKLDVIFDDILTNCSCEKECPDY